MSGVRIQMMGSFSIYSGDKSEICHALRSKKGSALIRILLLNHPEGVPGEVLTDALMLERSSGNPQNALKTLVSRTRKLLEEIYPGLGECIASKRGTYLWQALPIATWDVRELEEILGAFARKQLTLGEDARKFERAVELYAGDLCCASPKPTLFEAKRAELHEKYLSLVCEYLSYLSSQGDTERENYICRRAMSIDEYDKRLHKYLLESIGGDGDTRQNSADNYGASVQNLNRALDQSASRLTNELTSHEESCGAFLCGYEEFKDICDMQFRFVERSKAAMFIALISVASRSGEDFDSNRMYAVSQLLLETLENTLRKGDAITQLAPLTCAVSLPMVDYAASRKVLERVKDSFYRKNDVRRDALFSYLTQPYTRQGGSI